MPRPALSTILLIAMLLALTPIRLLLAQDWDAIKRSIRDAFPEVRQASVDTVAAWLEGPEAGEVVLLDTRPPAEFAVSHLRGARRVSPDTLDARAFRDLPRDARIVTYCSVGYRSSKVARWLARNGWTHVVNLEGSIFEWANRGYPVYRGGERVEAVHPYDTRWGRLLDAGLHAYEPPGEP